MSSQCSATTRKVDFFEFTKVAFSAVPEAENKLQVPCEF